MSFPHLTFCLCLSLSLLDLYVEREVDVHRDKDIRMRLRKEIGSISFLEDANQPLENSAEEKYTIIYYFHLFF